MGKEKRRQNIRRKGTGKAIEKGENRNICAPCVGGLMDLFYVWLFIERR